MAGSTYSYKPLDLPHETRILIVQPGEFNDPLQCSIQHVSLKSPSTPYTALSYCWNSALNTEPPTDEMVIPPSVAAYAAEDEDRAAEEIPAFLGRMLRCHVDRSESLYYTIGWPLPATTLFCDGIETSVGGELHAALRRIRSQGEELRIWVDALCINQADVAEKSEHVKLMGDIYSQAETVHIWLGESVGDEEFVYEALGTVSDVFDDMVDLFQAGRAALNEVQRRFINDKRIQKMDAGALRALLDRAWFERIWIIQEVANAKEIVAHIGKSELPWDYFVAIITTMRSYFVDVTLRPSSAPKSVCMMQSLAEALRRPIEDRMSLLSVLEETRSFRSTIPCDKIYAVLGMARDGADIVPDYSLESSEIFKAYTVKCLQEGNSLSILYHCVSSTYPDTLNLPSWVADWTRPGEVEPFYIRTLEANAAGSTERQIILSNDGTTLKAKGFVVDTVAVLETKKAIPTSSVMAMDDKKPRHPEHDNVANLEAVREMNMSWIKNAMEMVSGSRDDPRVYNQLWRAFMCNRTRDNELPTQAAAHGFDIFINSMLSGRTPAGEIRERVRVAIESGTDEEAANKTAESDHKAVHEFSGGNSRWTYSRRFFKSEAGRFGWAVVGAEPGDCIVILHGGKYPFLMRPSEPPGSFKIIGDCFLQGVMEGEAVGKYGIEEITII